MRQEFLPFCRPTIGDEEIAEVVASMRSGWLTTGPKVQRFEEMLAEQTEAAHAVAMNSGTAALHVALLSLGIGPGDEVITTPMTFAATVNMILAVGARPVLVDIDCRTLNIIPEQIEAAITASTRAIIPVHFAGLPCDMQAIHAIAREHGLAVIEDAAHAIGSRYQGRPIGALSDATCFSFHPIKTITTGEGGALCTNDDALAERASIVRFHGLSKDSWKRYEARGNAQYAVMAMGFKYNMLDLQAAIGLHQLPRLNDFIQRRTDLVEMYREGLSGLHALVLPAYAPDGDVHSWHLYTPRVRPELLGMDRDGFMEALKAHNIGTGLHFTAIHMHPYFAETLGYGPGSLPNAEWASDRILSLPLFPLMTDEDLCDVVNAVRAIAGDM
ncbi:MAG: DegT/DnrJ/EryC1/StrS aminotransferase family protein [Armatimonadetes bacterium]|nr:DegT/DnrJ/EryC1/StrS aminotransferase family protein [Armatimonadota bacterium]